MDNQTEGVQAVERLFQIVLRDRDNRAGSRISPWSGITPRKTAVGIRSILWNVDQEIANDILSALALIRQWHAYAEELGFRSQMGAV